MNRSDRRRTKLARAKADELDPSRLAEEGWRSGAQLRQRLGHFGPGLNERIGAIREASHLPPIVPKSRREALKEIAEKAAEPPVESDRKLIPLGTRNLSLTGLSVCLYAEGPEMVIRVPWGSLEEAEKAVDKLRRELEAPSGPAG